jgi:tetratricopeptide (TPR) repeat protein
MARKKRQIPQQFQTPAGAATVQDNKPKVAYRDEFQTGVGAKVEELGKNFEGKGKTLLYGIGALAVLAILVGIFFAWNRRSNAEAQTALGRAIETSQARVSSSPAPEGFIGKSFMTEKERAQAAVAEFQAVAEKYGNPVKDKARYLAATNRLNLDRPAAIQELTDLSKDSGEIGTLSKFALAQAKAGDGKLDEAAALYQELAALSNPILSKDTINLELAKVYEKQGKKDEAANLYFGIAKAASEAKDLDGKPIPLSQTASDAKDKLEALNPEKAKELAKPDASAPFTVKKL